MGGELGAVVEARLRPQCEAIDEAVRRDAHRARDEAVHRIGFVGGRRHQGGEGELHALRGVAAQDVAVERIEGEEVLIVLPARADLREHAALRGFRIDIIEMAKVARIFEVAEAGNAVDLVSLGRIGAFCGERRGAGDGARGDGSGGEDQHLAARQAVSIAHHCRPPVLAALASFHHQMVGNAWAPYSGIFSGCEYRSQ